MGRTVRWTLRRRTWLGAGLLAFGLGAAALAGAAAAQADDGADRPPSRIRTSVAEPDPVSGRVTGTASATDPDGDTVTFRAGRPSRGAVTMESDGSFAYDPTDDARRRARATRFTDVDRFRVTVDDGRGRSRSTSVRVKVAPINSPPVAGAPDLGAPRSTDGAVSGSVPVTDPDGDRITYRVSTAPERGELAVGADGSFTYTPTDVARHTAATGAAGTATDTATLAATDRYGATTTIPLAVAILPRNAVPTNARATVGQPDPSTWVVTGTVRADDADATR